MNEEIMSKSEPSLNKMRHPEYAQDQAWIVDFLNQAQVGQIATRSDQQPYITPSLFWYSPQQHEIYFHSNITGQVRKNAEQHPEVCFAASRAGKLLPSNYALEFGMQYESVLTFGKIRVVEEEADKKKYLYGLIEKYFPGMIPGEHYRPITDQELKRTSVYAITIEKWSGKRNWKEQAEQGDDWPALGQEWLG
jgi:nitroimidazol reductase NimA-like FMN-containing flavoprotein (pyridoxamine 5'-phosphate oxidase superfamily)